ncbi:unnamed protein product [Urochloa decumbens]|uniref:Uncharacterized protein n=1 Tax=Urochloa decumbens TaxID=240449 RepID=A0ABC9DIE1_9POAL
MAPSSEACAVAMAMAAPFLAMATNISSATAVAAGGNGGEKRRRTSSDALQRTVSDVSYELHHHQHGSKDKTATKEAEELHAIPEVEEAKCECCGMSEEYTPAYIRGVRCRLAGRWVCGLCAEAVTEEAEKSSATVEEALKTHMGVCKRFNGFGRTYPVLHQAEAMRDILRRRAKLGPRSRSSINPREVRRVSAAGTAIARSSSCMPFVNNEFSDRASINKN